MQKLLRSLPDNGLLACSLGCYSCCNSNKVAVLLRPSIGTTLNGIARNIIWHISVLNLESDAPSPALSGRLNPQ